MLLRLNSHPLLMFRRPVTALAAAACLGDNPWDLLTLECCDCSNTGREISAGSLCRWKPLSAAWHSRLPAKPRLGICPFPLTGMPPVPRRPWHTSSTTCGVRHSPAQRKHHCLHTLPIQLGDTRPLRLLHAKLAAAQHTATMQLLHVLHLRP